jgi:hypothetical protein
VVRTPLHTACGAQVKLATARTKRDHRTAHREDLALRTALAKGYREYSWSRSRRYEPHRCAAALESKALSASGVRGGPGYALCFQAPSLAQGGTTVSTHGVGAGTRCQSRLCRGLCARRSDALIDRCVGGPVQSRRRCGRMSPGAHMGRVSPSAVESCVSSRVDITALGGRHGRPVGGRRGRKGRGCTSSCPSSSRTSLCHSSSLAGLAQAASPAHPSPMHVRENSTGA